MVQQPEVRAGGGGRCRSDSAGGVRRWRRRVALSIITTIINNSSSPPQGLRHRRHHLPHHSAQAWPRGPPQPPPRRVAWPPSPPRGTAWRCRRGMAVGIRPTGPDPRTRSTVPAVAIPPAQSVPSPPLRWYRQFPLLLPSGSLLTQPAGAVTVHLPPLPPRLLPPLPLHPPPDRAWRRAPRRPELAPQRHWGLGPRGRGQGSPQ